ncbi:MAG: NAD-binding protein [Desulfovibrio sp.]|jgi:Trk K+ transport system NAD-binding subunit|nr:NAD-binding protein [Desulfovibrio sp.]
MKFIFSQMAFFMAQQSNRRNIKFMLRFTIFVAALVLLYSYLFHAIMENEGRDFTPLTGLYWTLTVMSTLGFGDITFMSDTGKMFTVIVLMSGIILFMLLLPFTFIRFVYSPWLEAQSNAMTPRKAPKDIERHLVIVGDDGSALSLALKCDQYDIPHVLLLDNASRAIELFDKGFKVVLGDLDSIDSYAAVRADHAALILAMHDDMKNTNIASTAHELSPDVPMAASIQREESGDILRLAGCEHVYHFSDMLGVSLARRVFSAKLESNIIGRFEGFCIAESPAHGTPLAGKNLLEADLRSRFGLNVVGIWQGNQYMSARPDTVIDGGAVLLLAGTADMLEKYDRSVMPPAGAPQPPTLILGGGRVGSAVAATLERRGISFRVVEQKPALVPMDNDRYVLGNAADIATLRAAGIEETQTVVITTHNDDLNIYLAIYCRKLRPDIQIICRSSLDHNVPSLYNAGANLVMSQAGLTANTVINLLRPGRVFMLTEGLNIFRVPAPEDLIGVSVRDSGIRRETDCNIIAVQNGGHIAVPPDPAAALKPGDELIIIGAAEAEQAFMARYYH